MHRVAEDEAKRAARRKRFARDKPPPAVEKKSIAWSGGKLTSNKEVALKKFLDRQAENASQIDAEAVLAAMRASSSKAMVKEQAPLHEDRENVRNANPVQQKGQRCKIKPLRSRQRGNCKTNDLTNDQESINTVPSTSSKEADTCRSTAEARDKYIDHPVPSKQGGHSLCPAMKITDKGKENKPRTVVCMPSSDAVPHDNDASKPPEKLLRNARKKLNQASALKCKMDACDPDVVFSKDQYRKVERIQELERHVEELERRLIIKG